MVSAGMGCGGGGLLVVVGRTYWALVLLVCVRGSSRVHGGVPWLRMSWARVAGAAGGAGLRGGGVEGVLVVCGTPALVGVVAGAGGGGIRDGVVR